MQCSVWGYGQSRDIVCSVVSGTMDRAGISMQCSVWAYGQSRNSTMQCSVWAYGQSRDVLCSVTCPGLWADSDVLGSVVSGPMGRTEMYCCHESSTCQ